MPSTYYVAFWNVKNLFDIENSLRRSSDRLYFRVGRGASWNAALGARKRR